MWIKICGIRDVATAAAVAAEGVQALGLNFYAGSSRHVDLPTAETIVAQLPSTVEPVGLFVNHPADEILEIAARCRLRTIQLHGDETPETVSRLREFRIIRAFRVDETGLGDMAAYLARCRSLDATPWACLVDAKVAGQYGGTGQRAPWELLHQQYRREDWPPLILAGGLLPENVATAIQAVRPWGVDVAGGVESSMACKDLARVRKFVEQARLIPDGA